MILIIHLDMLAKGLVNKNVVPMFLPFYMVLAPWGPIINFCFLVSFVKRDMRSTFPVLVQKSSFYFSILSYSILLYSFLLPEIKFFKYITAYLYKRYSKKNNTLTLIRDTTILTRHYFKLRPSYREFLKA